MHEKVEKLKSELCCVEEFKKDIFEKLKSWYSSNDPSCIDTNEFGDIADVVKDLSEAVKECWEAMYYQVVIEAMLGNERSRKKMGEHADDRYGYPHYPSVYGYPMMEPEMWARVASERFGYHDEAMHTGEGDVRTGYGANGMPMEDNRFGNAYRAYRMSKRGYTETGDEHKRMEMGEHAQEHLTEVMATIRDMWNDVPPEVRRKMKVDLTALVNEMNV